MIAERMPRLFYAALYVLCVFSYTKAIEIYDDEGFAFVENEPDTRINGIESNANYQSLRNGRILWPYPLNNKSDSIKDSKKPGAEEYEHHLSKLKGHNRKARFGYGYIQSPIMEMMMQTIAVNYSPTTGGDPFDFLRDSYALPKGKVIYKFTCHYLKSLFFFS